MRGVRPHPTLLVKVCLRCEHESEEEVKEEVGYCGSDYVFCLQGYPPPKAAYYANQNNTEYAVSQHMYGPKQNGRNK